MKTKLNISIAVLALSGFIVVQTATAQAPNPAKGEAKTTEPKFVYFKGSFTKFHHGKREEAINLQQILDGRSSRGPKADSFRIINGRMGSYGLLSSPRRAC